MNINPYSNRIVAPRKVTHGISSTITSVVNWTDHSDNQMVDHAGNTLIFDWACWKHVDI